MGTWIVGWFPPFVNTGAPPLADVFSSANCVPGNLQCTTAVLLQGWPRRPRHPAASDRERWCLYLEYECRTGPTGKWKEFASVVEVIYADADASVVTDLAMGPLFTWADLEMNYAPWTGNPNSEAGDHLHREPGDARRYQPGHPSYIGYCAAYEGLKTILDVGDERLVEHSARLNRRLRAGLDSDHFRCISGGPGRAPVITFVAREARAVGERLEQAPRNWTCLDRAV